MTIKFFFYIQQNPLIWTSLNLEFMIMRAGPRLKFSFALSLKESFAELINSINTIAG